MNQPPPDKPPLDVGEFCQLNSGSMDLLIVQANGDDLTVTWDNRGKMERRTFHRAMVRRVTRRAVG